MSTSSSFAGCIGAVVAAASYAAPAHAEEVVAATDAIADIRHARVELYCGHDAQGIADIHAACRDLGAVHGTSREPALVALQQAEFLARRHRVSEAQAALELALGQLVAAA